MSLRKKIEGFIGDNPKNNVDVIDENEFYKETFKQTSGNGGKMILLEPRAFSEAQGITDYLKSRNNVIVNFKRVTPEVAKRIVDFLSGSIYAIGGELEKIGNGIFLCTPNNVNVEGKISGERDTKKPTAKTEAEDEGEFDW